MRTQHSNDEKTTRVLTEEELKEVSGGARTFNPQPDPPGVMHNPPGY